ncbi:hypothetical protein B4U84_28495 [Westiellopsis prolifica IICB1]|nr:hypothetical protein B4U84_28495 [Westiellopsis prolifica IICB1]
MHPDDIRLSKQGQLSPFIVNKLKRIMATKKNPITDPDGSKAAAQADRVARQRIKERFSNPLEAAQNTVEAANSAVKNVASTAQSVSNGVNAVSNNFKAVRRAFDGGSELVTSSSDDSFAKAEQIAQGFGIADISPKELMGSDPYASDAPIPEMTAAEANRHKLTIQRQNNALDVRLEKIKQGRKVVQLATENRRLIGEVVGFHTAGIEVGSKIIDNQISETNYRAKQSKLEQTEELLTQQIIATQGTVNLTEGIRLEWNLKFERQQAKNQGLRLEVEGAVRDAEIKRQELEAKLLEV